MEYFGFKINKLINGWAEIVFLENDTAITTIDTSYARDSFTELLEGIYNLWTGSKDVVCVQFDLEKSWLDLMLINFPGGVLRVELFDTVLWDNINDCEDKPQPIPLYTTFVSHYYVAYNIIRAIESFSPEQWPARWWHLYPQDAINKLINKMSSKDSSHL